MLKITEKFRCAEQDLREASSVKLAFFGDSVTQGCFEIREGSTDFITVTDGEAVYHNRLRRILQSLYPHCPVNVRMREYPEMTPIGQFCGCSGMCWTIGRI